MADRYWVGGAGTWNGTNTANWSTTSGGGSGAGVPTATDNVFFPAGTTYTVTIGNTATCQNFTVLSGSGVRTFIGSSNLTLYGSFDNQTTTTVWTHSGQILFSATTTGMTVKTSGATMPTVYFQGVGGEWILQDNWYTQPNAYIYHTNGTFDTNGYSFDIGAFYSTTSSVRTLKLGSGTHIVRYVAFSINTTNLTLNAGTSTLWFPTSPYSTQILITGNNPATFYTLILEGYAFNKSFVITGSQTFSCDTLSIVPGVGTDGYTTTINIGAGFTAANISTGGFTNNARPLIFIGSNTSGAVINVTGTWSSLTDRCIWFKSVTLTGPLAGTSGSNLGNMGGNSGIAFPASRTLYWHQSVNSSWYSASWATSSGGSVSSSNIPRPQDDVIISAVGSSINSNQTIWGALCYCRSFTATNLTTSLGFSGLLATGDVTIGPSATITTSAFTFTGVGTQTFTCPVSIANSQIYVQTIGDFRLGSNITTTGPFNIDCIGGNNFYTDNYNVSCYGLAPQGTTVSACSWNYGSSTITLTGATNSFFMSGNQSGSPLTIYPGTSTVILAPSSGTSLNFYPYGHSFYNLILNPPSSSYTFSTNIGFKCNVISRMGTNSFTWNFITAGQVVEMEEFSISGTSGSRVAISTTAPSITFRKTGAWNVGVNSTSTSSTGLNLVAGICDYVDFGKVNALVKSKGNSLFFGNNF